MVTSFNPHSLTAALEILDSVSAIPYAGGTDLMIEAQEEKPYVFLSGIPELKGVRLEGDTLVIGAASTFTELLEEPLTPPLLAAAVSQIAAPAIRNTATIGGNIANGSPKADSALILYNLNADVVLESVNGQRIVPVREFVADRSKTVRKQNELLTQIRVPINAHAKWYYKKVGARAALAISRVSFAGVIDIDADNVIRALSTAYGAVDRTVLVRPEIDAMLIGLTIEQAQAAKKDYLQAWEEAIVPISGRVSAEYRKDVCMNLLKDFLDENGI